MIDTMVGNINARDGRKFLVLMLEEEDIEASGGGYAIDLTNKEQPSNGSIAVVTGTTPLQILVYNRTANLWFDKE